ncbi:MAG: response regulator transcription factor [Terriglobales bacterium]
MTVRRACRVLVVDDEPAIADTLAIILNTSGYEAHAAYDCSSARQRTSRWLPDLILSDIALPDGNGVDLVIELQHLYPHAGVLLFSGQEAAEAPLRRAAEAGYEFEVLAKPVHPTELLERIAAHCLQ